jgi:hypothetical protein
LARSFHSKKKPNGHVCLARFGHKIKQACPCGVAKRKGSSGHLSPRHSLRRRVGRTTTSSSRLAARSLPRAAAFVPVAAEGTIQLRTHQRCRRRGRRWRRRRRGHRVPRGCDRTGVLLYRRRKARRSGGAAASCHHSRGAGGVGRGSFEWRSGLRSGHVLHLRAFM